MQWALYGKHKETCQFLVYAGADIDYKLVPLRSYTVSPYPLTHVAQTHIRK